MTITVTGRLKDGAEAPIQNLHVQIKDVTEMFDQPLGQGDSISDGTFTFTIPEDPHEGPDPVGSPRTLVVFITTQGGREVYTYNPPDPSGNTLALGDIPLRQADVSGLPVTLLSANPTLIVRDGNAVLPLVDDSDAWGHFSQSITAAAQSIDIMQLDMDVPDKFDSNPANEQPDIVLAFKAGINPVDPGIVNSPDNVRLERALAAKATAPSNVKVRIMISGSDPSEFVKILEDIGEVALGILFAIPVIILYVFDVGPTRSLVQALWHHVFGNVPGGDAGAVRKYFAAAAPAVKVAPFTTRLLNVIHAKAAIIDAAAASDTTEAILFGSPFSQSYWDTNEHAIYNGRRGPAEGEPIPVHDVSIGLRGPVVKDVYDTYSLHWNRDAASADTIPPITMSAAVTTPKTGEAITTVQLVRTIDSSAFPSLPNGEKGVLEAYLRAIDTAKTYIYFENQYFTNRAIGTALAAALKDSSRPDLQVILMVNVIPDMPFYPKWQAELIAQIRADAGTDSSGNPNGARLGVFTAWTHNAKPNGDTGKPWSSEAKPMIMPNYLHTKTAIVDGSWATVGSANLDGASLDFFQILHAITITDPRNHELNYVMFNGNGFPTSPAIGTLRTSLWGEHLGLAATDPQLVSSPTNDKGVLALWKKVAAAKLAALVADPTQINPALGRVLEYPANTTAGYGKAPYVDFLTKAGVDLTKVDVLDKTTAYDFKNGAWA